MDDKRIALLTAQADEAYQSSFIKGVMERAFETGYTVCVFSMFIKYQNSPNREIGDSAIFSLINFKQFDAVIIHSDTIQTPGLEKKLQKKIHDIYDGPVVCVDTESRFFPSFWTDGYKGVYETVNHIIKVHGKKDIAYLTGRSGHMHSVRRLAAYRDAMADNGLEVKEARIFYGDFWYTSGASLAEHFTHEIENLPEAIVCANDCMAIGFIEELEKHGINVPDDIIVAGYGADEEGRTAPKMLTSVFVPAEGYGRYAVDCVLHLMKSDSLPAMEMDADLMIGETCGCKRDLLISGKRGKWTTDESDEGFYSIHNTFEEDMLRCESLEEVLSVIFDNIHYIKDIKRFDLCLDPAWVSAGQLKTEQFPVGKYSDRMIHALSYDAQRPENARLGLFNSFSTDSLLPFMEDLSPYGYTFSPLSGEQFSFGYVCVSWGSETRSYEEVYRLWIAAIVRGLEGMRRKLSISRLDQRLQMSGMYSDSEQIKNKYFTQKNVNDEEHKTVEKLLDDNAFSYHFQPIVSARSGEIYSYEALMRSGADVNIPPLTIIRHAEGMGRLKDVEKSTFLNILDIADKHPEWFEGKKIFINSIPGCILNAHDRKKIREGIVRHSGSIVVEITEQAELTDEELLRLKGEFTTAGAGIAVDDYGTGYSNVSNLIRYMPDVVKIDRSLLSGIHKSAQKEHFVRDIIEFCHSNDILALAEGVETGEELRAVIRLGADLIQGYYTARPSAKVLGSIDENIKNEIIRYYQETVDGSGEDEYIAGQVPRISAAHLIREHKSTIVIGAKDATFKDVTIVGNPGMSEKLHLEILEGYEGRITLENVTLSNVRKRPCINLADGTHVTLMLIGRNKMLDGGIMVPENATLAFEGEGSLIIDYEGDDGFGIGNRPDKRHGDISFYQDGEIRIDINGKNSVGIGSGLGGHIHINKGQFKISLNGEDDVCIGSTGGEASLEIHDCLIYCDILSTRGVCIGSISKAASVRFYSCKVVPRVCGSEVVCIGTLYGEQARLNTFEMSLQMGVKADNGPGAGVAALSGRTEMSVTACTVRFNGEGREVYVYGGQDPETYISFKNSDVNLTVSTQTGAITKAPEENVRITNGRYRAEFNSQVTEQ